MGRKSIGKEPLSSAEKQRRYRAKQRAKIEALKTTAMLPFGDQGPDEKVIREQVRRELKKSWEPELKAERLAAERKKGRELAKQKDRTSFNARVDGICDCAAFFVGKDRVDIAQSILHHFYINREMAKGALQADKRIKSMTLESLDKAGAWDKPPITIR